MGFSNKNILIISPEDWGDVFLSKHHYAWELAKYNKVWFLNAKGNRVQKKIIISQHKKNNLCVINYFNLYFGFGKIPYFFTYIINFLLTRQIKKNIGMIDIVWSFEQSKFFDLQLFGPKVAIFHPVDFISSIKKFKFRIANSADILISVSQEILDSFNVATPKYLINHGVTPVNNKADDLLVMKLDKSKVNVLFVGNINSPFIDIHNFLQGVNMNPKIDFHIIGPTGNSNLGSKVNLSNYKSLLNYNNVKFHGVIDQIHLVNTMKKFDILVCLYNNEKFPIRISNSHKILEYLLSGKVVISNYFSSYSNLSDDLIIILSSNSDFGSTIKMVASRLSYYNSDLNFTKREQFALNNTYSKQISKIEELVSVLKS